MAQECTKPHACAKCGRNHFVIYHEGFTGCFKCVQEGHFIGECPNDKQGGGNLGNRAQYSSVAPPNKLAPRGTTSGTGGGTNCLYAHNNCHVLKNFPDIFTDLGVSLSFVTSYVAMNFEISPELDIEPFSVSTPFGESILGRKGLS
ncbi:uncharacterized protein [Solanum lycopersicum]|uniref:uncharacterized protein n=1 Tax=Solanum lycopersicum TaxID=4081 RepID=UPI0002BCB3EE|nr:uncharacterized protein LOC101252769 [Solanum lycopersicum]